jgi:hypothetical protein
MRGYFTGFPINRLGLADETTFYRDTLCHKLCQACVYESGPDLDFSKLNLVRKIPQNAFCSEFRDVLNPYLIHVLANGIALMARRDNNLAVLLPRA